MALPPITLAIASSVAKSGKLHCELQYQSPNILGLTSALWNTPAINTVEALTPCLCLSLSVDLYGAALHQDIKFLNYACLYLAEHIRKNFISELYLPGNRESGAKKMIAAKAAELIQPGESIFVSAGTTCAELARCLPVFPLKVCSDGICTVSNISSLPNISVELLGGDVDLNIMRVEGISVLNRLDSLHFSKAFMSAMCLNPDYGFAHNSALTVAILEKVIQHSDQTLVLLDSTKISDSFYPYTLSLSSVNTIVTDTAFPRETADSLRSKGSEVVI